MLGLRRAERVARLDVAGLRSTQEPALTLLACPMQADATHVAADD